MPDDPYRENDHKAYCRNCKERPRAPSKHRFSWGLCEQCLRAYNAGHRDATALINSLLDLEERMKERGWGK